MLYEDRQRGDDHQRRAKRSEHDPEGRAFPMDVFRQLLVRVAVSSRKQRPLRVPRMRVPVRAHSPSLRCASATYLVVVVVVGVVVVAMVRDRARNSRPSSLLTNLIAACTSVTACFQNRSAA